MAINNACYSNSDNIRCIINSHEANVIDGISCFLLSISLQQCKVYVVVKFNQFL